MNPLLAEFHGVNPTRSFWNIFIHHFLSPLLKKKTISYAILSVILVLIMPFLDCFGSLLFHYFSSITSQVTILLLICTSTRGKRCEPNQSTFYLLAILVKKFSKGKSIKKVMNTNKSENVLYILFLCTWFPPINLVQSRVWFNYFTLDIILYCFPSLLYFIFQIMLTEIY